MAITVTAPEHPKPDPNLRLRKPPQPFTATDLDAMEDDGYRREVIEGRLIVTPSPIGEHQGAAYQLVLLLEHHRPAGFRVMIAPYDWRPASGDSLQPDLMVIREEGYNPKGFQLATPLLVVEILSPSTMIYDQTEKRRRYETLEVPSYWIVDPAAPSLIALQLQDGCYVEVAQVTGSETYEADLPYPVTVVPADLVR
ncbi:MAG: Uma2 family endonuclease [Actinobacteria bacterium]|jgi:Uma2 family endonuclease|nr:Uma2 family endonuclease [Actinomycetota bacterium]